MLLCAPIKNVLSAFYIHILAIPAEKSELSRVIKIQLFYIGYGGPKLATRLLLCAGGAGFKLLHFWEIAHN